MDAATSCNLKDVLSQSIYPLDSRILLVPLTEEEEHNKFPDVTCEQSNEPGQFSIELDHPIVPLLSDLAITAFNQLCKMYVKKDEDHNIYEAEFINVKCSPKSYGYMFLVKLEAMEDVCGVYKAKVLCNIHDGRRTLIKFFRSHCAPAGRKFKGTSDLIRDKFVSQAVKEQKKSIKDQLRRLRGDAKKGKEKTRASARLVRLKDDYKVVKGACRVFDKYAHRLKRISWKIKRVIQIIGSFLPRVLA